MERLTQRCKCGICGSNEKVVLYPLYKIGGDEYNDHGLINQCFEKLAHYEDVEGQGLLLRLPCKVGDTVYCFDYPGTDVVVVVPEEVKQICVLEDGVSLETSGGYYFPHMIGKIVFFTEEEAEAALEKKKGE